MTKKNSKRNSSSASGGRLGGFLRNPAGQLTVVALVALIIYLIAVNAGGEAAPAASTLAPEISVDEAYQMYEAGAFVLDVRTQQEYDELRAPNTTLIPLDQLAGRLGELPRDREIVVICRSGNRSQEARDILLEAGFSATSVSGGMMEWAAKGYPIEGAMQ